MKNRRKWLWIARILLLASAITILIASCYFYQPRNYPFGMDVSPQAGQTLLYGGVILAITGFAWRWPGAGGIVAIFYGIYKIFDFGSLPLYPKTLIPAPAFYLLYGIFIIGGILSLLASLGREAVPHYRYTSGKKLRWIARITAFAPIVLTVIVYTLVYPSWFVFGAVPGLVTAGIAWLWLAPGGFLMLLLTVPGFYNLFESNYDFQMKLPAYILCLVFIASGVLHLIIAWRKRILDTRI